MLNPKLKPGDRVRLIDMNVHWDDGDRDNVGEIISKLSLISSADYWDLGGKRK